MLLSATLERVPLWESQGPGPVTGGQTVGLIGNPVTGAVDAIAVHPTNSNIIYLGTVGGGVWKSTNALHGVDGIDNDGDAPITRNRPVFPGDSVSLRSMPLQNMTPRGFEPLSPP